MKNLTTPRTLAECNFQTGYPTITLFYGKPWWVRFFRRIVSALRSTR